MSLIELSDTRSGGGCLAAVRQAGAPFSLFTAIKEIGMLQRHRCVSVLCDRCGDSPGELDVSAHFPTSGAALSAVAGLGWRLVNTGLLCPSCSMVVGCKAVGHEFTVWYSARCCGGEHPPVRHPGGVEGCGVRFRFCTRCGRDESRRLGTDLSVVA